MICVECINCLCINIANGIRLLDKIAIFVYTGKHLIQVRAFESNFPLVNFCYDCLDMTQSQIFFQNKQAILVMLSLFLINNRNDSSI